MTAIRARSRKTEIIEPISLGHLKLWDSQLVLPSVSDVVAKPIDYFISHERKYRVSYRVSPERWELVCPVIVVSWNLPRPRPRRRGAYAFWGRRTRERFPRGKPWYSHRISGKQRPESGGCPGFATHFRLERRFPATGFVIMETPQK